MLSADGGLLSLLGPVLSVPTQAAKLMAWAVALAVTLIIEVPLVVAFYPGQRWRLGLVATVMNVATNLTLNLVLHRHLFLGEMLAVLSEAAAYVAFAKPRNLAKGLLVASFANLLSFSAGSVPFVQQWMSSRTGREGSGGGTRSSDRSTRGSGRGNREPEQESTSTLLSSRAKPRDPRRTVAHPNEPLDSTRRTRGGPLRFGRGDTALVRSPLLPAPVRQLFQGSIARGAPCSASGNRR